LLPRRWMMPSLMEESFPEMKDNHLIGLQEDSDKMEVSLDTAGYKPDELKINVIDDEVRIVGKHEEKSESGHIMVSRQFCRRYTLPQGAKKENITSNLSQDGVMVITVPKEEKLKEVKETENIKVNHVKNVEDMNRVSEEKDERGRKSNMGKGRVDDFEGPGEMQKRRRSLSQAGRSRASSEVRESTSVEEVSTKNKEQVEVRKSSRTGDLMDDMLVPMTLRNPFLEDPFFKNTLANIESARGDFF